MEYLKLPLKFSSVLAGQELATCSMEGSIMRFLHLMLTTVQEEYAIDENFGLAFWEDEFSTHTNIDWRKEQLVTQVKQQIAKYEPRLTAVEVQAQIKSEMLRHQNILFERRRVEIAIVGKLTHSMAPFSFATAFFIGPLDLD